MCKHFKDSFVLQKKKMSWNNVMYFNIFKAVRHLSGLFANYRQLNEPVGAKIFVIKLSSDGASAK